MNNQIKYIQGSERLFYNENIISDLNLFNIRPKLINYCYMRGFKHGTLIAENLSKFNLVNYFSVALDSCPCISTVESYQEFKNGFDDGYNMIYEETNKKK